MPLAEARAVLSSSSGEEPGGLEVIESDSGRDRESLASQCGCAWRFTPRVALPPVPGVGRPARSDPRTHPESLLANITGCGHLFGDDHGLAMAMQEDWSERGFRVRVAVAGSPGTAWAIAHAAHWTGQPAAPLVVTPGRDEQWMRRLPIEALALEARVVRTLRELGVLRVGRLLELPTSEVKRRFGDETLWRIDRALGRIDEPLDCLPMPDPVVAWRAFEHPVSRMDWLEEVLHELVVEVAEGLKRRGRVAWRLVCRVCHEGPGGSDRSGGRMEWATGLVEPGREAAHLWGLVRLRMQRNRWPRQVTRLEVQAEGLVVPERPQETLFDADAEAACQRVKRGLARLVERLVNRLGRHAVAWPVLCDDAVPEAVVQLRPVAGPEVDETSGRADLSRPEANGGRVGPASRPLRLIDGPRAIEVMAVAPQGPPVRFAWEGRTCHVSRYWGPERIETGWWTERQVARDYYRVEIDTGEWYWVFQRRGEEDWFVHGVFE